MKTETVKGFKDYLCEEAEKRALIKEVVKQVFEQYGFQPAETPTIEYEEFVRGENANDEAVSDTYKFRDKGNRKLALRYELTFPLKRIARNKKLPFKRYQIGRVFRDEPITGNRTREFTQCDADIIGSTLKDDAEILSVISTILKALKIEATIFVNNRKLLNEILEAQGIKKNKEQIIREIDKLDKLSVKEVSKNLEKYCAEKVLKEFKKPIKEFEKYESFNEIKELLEYCKAYGVKVEFSPTLARGLAYYSGTVFEVKTKKIKETIFGGGSYVFNGTPGVGFGVSVERLSVVTSLKLTLEKYLIVSLNQDKKAIQLAQKLRGKGKNVSMFYGKPSKALDYANSYKIQNVIFVGENEVKKKVYKVKIMKTGREVLLKF